MSDVQVDNPKVSGLVTFTLLIEGSEMSSLYSVVSLNIQKGVNKIPYAKITLLDGEAATGEFATSDTDDFAPGKSIEILAGYESEESSIFKGLITRHGIKIRADKSSLLLIECRNQAAALTIGRKSRFFHELEDSEAINQILGDYSLGTLDVEATTVVNKELVQFQSTDWDFIMSRAEANGRLVIVDDDGFRVVVPDASQKSKIGAEFGSNIFDFEAYMDARYQLGTSKNYSWDPANQEMIDEASEEPDLKDQGNISSSKLAEALGIDEVEFKNAGALLKEELKEISNAQLLKSRLAKIIGKVKISGNADIKLGDHINLKGVGERFNGDAFVSAIGHEIREGNWVTSIHFGLSPFWFSETNNINSPLAAGLLPAVSGLQTATVLQLQDDPDSEERVLIKIPGIDDKDTGIWARMARLDAGNERGAFFMPEIDDEVLIGYLNDDPRHPVILGMLHSSAKPAPLKASDDNHEKGIITREGLKVLFDDDTKTIVLSTSDEHMITITEDSDGEIKLEDKNSNIIKMTKDGISIESAADINIKAEGDINLEGANINLNAQTELKAEGASGGTFSSGGTTVIEGALVQIN